MYCNKCGYNNPPDIQFCRNCEINLSAKAETNASPTPAIALVYAGFWLRLLAVFLDILVIAACVILLLFFALALIAYTGRDNLLHDNWALAFFLPTIVLISVLLFILMESGATGATLGKRWINIKIQCSNGERLSTARAIVRRLTRVLSYLVFLSGFLIQPFTRRKQALHDLLAGTVVVKANDSNKVSIMATLLVLFFALIVPVLTTAAVAGKPLFDQYVQSVQIDKAIKTGRQTALAVAHFYRNNGRVPVVIEDTGTEIYQSPLVAQIEINQENGEITLTLSKDVRKDIRQKHLLFTPTRHSEQSIIWQCHSADIENRFLPPDCTEKNITAR